MTIKHIPIIPNVPVLLTILAAGVCAVTYADEVTDWNENLLHAAHAANSSPPVAIRISAIVQASVFDAVNGIERRYTPIHVPPAAAPGASIRAAVVQAA